MQQHVLDKVYGFFGADISQFILSLALVAVAVITFRRREAWSIALLVGSLSHLAKQVFWWFIGVIGYYKMTHADSRFAHLFFPTDSPADWVYTFKHFLQFFSILLPVGLAWWFARYVLHLTKRSSQPLTSKKIST
jgi:hypothetical protein